MNEQCFLKLYITGKSSRSEKAIQSVRYICEEVYPGHFKLDIVDVLEQPQIAEEERILATPTLIRHFPPPVRRIIGDLGNIDEVLSGLDYSPSKGFKQKKEVQHIP